MDSFEANATCGVTRQFLQWRSGSSGLRGGSLSKTSTPAAAKERGIPVSNIPTYGTASVGQFAIAMLLEICHHVAYHSETVHDGKWAACPDWCYWDYPLFPSTEGMINRETIAKMKDGSPVNVVNR